ncbi:Lrp/AsnC family transcriptional regulator [Rhodobacteraceae bacterium 2376]|uniref:Lrp/AsnC family transcriptional regulator n=1 Tax=Rhabdonatronobacter sediminivivens TaxID=2743469 RepID=A0A7Z0HZ09_9RHOB|nr:Lrp/AsnC family transcriptional regulator [Rhabdonatronobacter sediminivivens]NYS24805.1 Lrp/AsnC family transcriptional regulator [Rhabdonatronobacter sediminivivens]
MPLDRTDIEILRLLQNDARLMNKQIAAAVGLAPSSCHERIRRLWRDGVITGTETLLDPQALGYPLAAVLFVTISKAGQLRIDALMDDLVAVPEIREVFLVTGRYDLVVSLVARDMDHLKSIAYTALSAREEITGYETSVAYDHRRGKGVLEAQPTRP